MSFYITAGSSRHRRIAEEIQKHGIAQNEVIIFTYKELDDATNGFSDEQIIGEGGFGVVYKGCIESIDQVSFLTELSFLFFFSCFDFLQVCSFVVSRLAFFQVVAVKQLDRQREQGTREFISEVLMLSLLKHPNLVNLIGYCVDDNHRILTYEYMSNGSLEDHLLGKKAHKISY